MRCLRGRMLAARAIRLVVRHGCARNAVPHCVHALCGGMSDERANAPCARPRIVLWEQSVKRLILLRHGSTDSNASGVMRGWSEDCLSDLGRRQAEQSAQGLLSMPAVDVIYTSSLPRSMQTGAILSRRLGVAVYSLARMPFVTVAIVRRALARRLGSTSTRPTNPESRKWSCSRSGRRPVIAS